MTIGINIYTSPPSNVELEAVRKCHDKALVTYLFLVTAAALSLAVIFFEPQTVAWMPEAAATFITLCLVGCCLYSALRMMALFRKMVRIGETGPETLEAILCSDVPSVTAYCTAVKKQGRMLTMDEAEALMRLCMHPDVFMKIVASYERHDAAHPFSGFHCG